MISEANKQAIEAAGLSFILGMKIPEVPYAVKQWRREHPGIPIPDGHTFVQPWPSGAARPRRDQMIYYRYRAGRARRTLRGIDEQVAKAWRAIPWRYLPHDYPPWATVYGYFAHWQKDGVFTQLSGMLRRLVGSAEGCDPEPTACVIDAQSVKTSTNVPTAA